MHELTNICILYTDSQVLFYKCLITVVIAFLRGNAAQKIILYYLLLNIKFPFNCGESSLPELSKVPKFHEEDCRS